MNLKIDIEIDWIGEDNTLDEVVKAEIVAGVTDKVYDMVNKEIRETLTQKLDDQVIKKVDENTQQMFDEFCNREIALNDQYGHTIKVWPNLIELMKARFDNFLEERVDRKSGKPTNSGYNGTTTRIRFMIDNQLTSFADKFTTDTVKKVSEEIKKHVSDGLTNKLGGELMKVLKVDKMLKS
jgi:hypothetical protein